jgi:hypothetical protein
MVVCDFLSRVALLGVDFEVRAGFLMRSDINLKNPARRAQTLAADQKTTHQQPCNHPKRTNELVCTCAALRVPTNAPQLPLGSSRAHKCRHNLLKARTPRTNTRRRPKNDTPAALQIHTCKNELVCTCAALRVPTNALRLPLGSSRANADTNC